MPLSPGARLGLYDIVAPLGAGGMGEVYRARDARLGRDVAIKVIPASVASDPDRLGRFEREAQAAASLSHPNIVSIFEFGTHDNQPFVVMELLEGETLRQRLAASPPERGSDATKSAGLPMRKAIETAVQIARGLAAAHDKGLVHRDLKPENIFLLNDGHVKILDFGLARAAASENGSGATETVAALTDPGVVLGTIGYMAPEQVRGRAVDARADLFAFGAVLYEMLTGARAFQRDTPADTMTAILKEDPPELTAVRADLPPALDRIVRHCLEKNPAERFHSARDVAFALDALSGSAATSVIAAQIPSGAADRPRRRMSAREIAPWALAIAGLLAAGLLWWRWPAAPPPPALARFSLPIDSSQSALSATVAASPDGQSFVVSVSPARDTRLLLRRLDSADMTPLAGTEGALAPFWSPDGQAIGFIADRTLKRYDLVTSSVRPIAALPQITVQPAWGRGTILLASPVGGPLMTVPDTGGTPQPLGALDATTQEAAQLRPVFLPDGRRFFYYSGRAGSFAVVLGSLDSPERRVLDVPDGRIVWAGDDRVVFRRGDALYAQAITYDPLALTGEPVQIAAEAASGSSTTVRESVGGGLLVFAEPSAREQQFRWYGRDGRSLSTVGAAGLMTTFDLSRDGRKIVANVRAKAASGANLWVIDAENGTTSRVTIGQMSDSDPRWSPDGRYIVFGSTRDSARSAHRVGLAADTPSLLWKYEGRMYSGDDWSADGKWLLFHDASVPLIQAREMDPSGAPKGPPIDVARGLTGTLDQARMSPDGKWVAYNSTETGRSEVYVVPFPANGERYTMSRAGGSQPTWKGDGTELYYFTPDNALVAVKVSVVGGKFTTGSPVELVRPRIGAVSPSVEQYMPHPSGTKFLFLDTVGDEKNLSVGVVLNWRR